MKCFVVLVFTLIHQGKNFPIQNCTWPAICNCSEINGYVHANCSHRALSKAPLFRLDVVSVDLSSNVFEAFPSNLPERLQYLYLANNLIKTISNYSLSKLTNLENLTISYNNLNEIEPGTFKLAFNLFHLDLSHNKELSLSVLTNISYDLQFTNIKVLNLEKVQCTYGLSTAVYTKQVQHLSNTSLEELNLASNRINHFEFGMFLHLPKSLRVFNVADNILSFGAYILNLNQLTNVEVLNASFQSSFHPVKPVDFNFRCKDWKSQNPSVFDSVHSSLHTTKRNLGAQDIRNNLQRKMNITTYFPPNIQKIYFHDNLYKFVFPEFFFNTTGKLTHVHAQNNIIYEWEGPLYGMQTVEYFDLSNNFCSKISPYFFIDFLNLRVLNISNNILGQSLEMDIDGKIFQNQRKVKVLNLANNKIAVLPSKIFQGFSELTHINLASNTLDFFNVSISHLHELVSIDLSSNQLSGLSEETRASLNKISESRKIFINLVRNPLQCSCKNLNFLSWMEHSKGIKFLHFKNYTCVFQNATLVTFRNFTWLLKEVEKECASFTLAIAMISALLLVLITIIMSKIFHRYRWKIRYLYYVAKGNRRNKMTPYDKKKHCKYHFDAFISYAEEENKFVRELVAYLEENFKLRLCIHHRDFIPGTDIADNITNAIHNSKRTVGVLTSSFIKSYWCNFELNMARMEAIYSREGSNVLLFIVLQRGVLKSLPLKWMDLIESESYMEISLNDEKELSAFRIKLAQTLKADVN
ncbi:toll-like receptor 4 [Saccostrea cucullata]|uniref:toll-like receptor 4 n=1 Tax=Saccostrea cuccullata TaxID=36930 RepID=UPI002ED224F3